MFDDLVLISGAFQKMNPGFRLPQIQKLFINKRLISEKLHGPMNLKGTFLIRVIVKILTYYKRFAQFHMLQ